MIIGDAWRDATSYNPHSGLSHDQSAMTEIERQWESNMGDNMHVAFNGYNLPWSDIIESLAWKK